MERTHNSRPSKVGHTVARPRNTREKVKRKKNPFAFVRIRIQLLSVRLNVLLDNLEELIPEKISDFNMVS